MWASPCPRLVRAAILLTLLVAVVAGGIILAMPDDAVPAAARDDGPPTLALGGLVTRADPACALCHYGWRDVIFVEGNVTPQPDGTGSRVRLTVAPTSTFNLTDLRLLDPTGLVDATPSLLAITSDAVTNRLAPATGGFDVPGGAGGVNLRILPTNEFSRALLHVVLEGPGGRVEATSRGSVSMTLDPPGGLQRGDYRWTVTLVDGPRVEEALRVRYDIAPSAAHLAPLATGEAPAVFTFDVDGPLPDGYVLAVRSENHHPVDPWLLPNWGDHADYVLWVAPKRVEGNATPAVAGPPANRTASALPYTPPFDASWPDGDRATIHHERIDATLVRSQDSHGEWLRRANYIERPEAEHAYPPLPPGTSHVEVRITWATRTPASPSSEWFLSYSLGTQGPTFFYPPADETGPGVLNYVIPVDPSDWETGPDGGFQALPLIRMVDGRAAFDGWREIVVDAVRDPSLG